MKKNIICIACLLTAMTMNAQTVNVHFKNGQTVRFNSSNVDFVDFSEKPADPTLTAGEIVDLGLSVYWASCNVGATKPEEYGNYYAWGETSTKNSYSQGNYTYYDSDKATYIDIGSDISGTEYDAARVNLGGEWRMPTKDEMTELIKNCSWEWTQINSVNGYKVTGPNGNSIFLPAAENSQIFKNGHLCYWCSTSHNEPVYSLYLDVSSSTEIPPRVFMSDCITACSKWVGNTIRPVSSTSLINTNNSNRNISTSQPEISRLEFPKVKGGNSFVVIHKVNNAPDPDGVNYSIEWDSDKKAQRWSCYQMNKGYSGNAGRSDAWTEDPDIPSAYRLDESQSFYSGSGFTKGQIIPSADRQYSLSANRQTFYYSNIHPQYEAFNSQWNSNSGYSPWARLEDLVRTWTRRSSTDTLYVCKGGTIDSEENILMRIKNQLIVPKYFFVAVLAKSNAGYAAIAFYIKHDNNDHGSNPLSDYAMSIDQLEEKTGIDFFCNLPDNDEKKVESSYSLNIWGIQ